jgi:hypothetical protein
MRWEGRGAIPPRLALEADCPPEAFRGFHLFRLTGVEEYAGEATTARRPQIANLLEVPERATSTGEVLRSGRWAGGCLADLLPWHGLVCAWAEMAIAALTQCDRVCKQLLERARDGSTSSRLILQYQIIHLIDNTLTEVVPLPKAANDPDQPKCTPSVTGHENTYYRRLTVFAPPPTGIWRMRLPRDTQLRTLTLVYQLLLTYGTVWQALDQPPRSIESERAVVAAAALAIFDKACIHCCS